MQPPKWLLVLGLGACVLSDTNGQPESNPSPVQDNNITARAPADEILHESDTVSAITQALPASGVSAADLAASPRDSDVAFSEDLLLFCDEDHCDCCVEDGDLIDNGKGKMVKNDCKFFSHRDRCRHCPIYWKKCPERSPFRLAAAHDMHPAQPRTDGSSHAHELQSRTVNHSPHDLLEDQCNSEAFEAMEVIVQNYLDDLVDNVNQKLSATSPCSQTILYGTADDEDIGGSLSKLWHWPEKSKLRGHHDSRAGFRGNTLHAITVLMEKDPMLMNTTLAINPEHRIKKPADFDDEMCVVNVIAAVVRPDDRSKPSTLKVTLSSEGIKDYIETWSCSTSGTRQKTLITIDRDEHQLLKPDPLAQTIPHDATIGQTFSVDSTSIPFNWKGLFTVTATDSPGYSGTITLSTYATPYMTIEYQALTDYQRTPPVIIATKSVDGKIASWTSTLTSAASVVTGDPVQEQELRVGTTTYTELEALHMLKKKECQHSMLLHPTSKGQKCQMTIAMDGKPSKATVTATATKPPGWSAKIKDGDKHTGTLQIQFLTNRQPPVQLLTADVGNFHTTMTLPMWPGMAPARVAHTSATPLSRLQQRSHVYAGLPSPASSGKAFTSTFNIDGHDMTASGSITATSPMGFVATIEDQTATETLYAQFDEDEDPIMVRGSIFSDGMVATINEPYPPAGFTGIVNPGIFKIPDSRHTEAHLEARQAFTPPTTLPTTTTTTIGSPRSSSSQVVTVVRTSTLTVFPRNSPYSTTTQPPVTITSIAMSLGDKIIPITGSSKQIVNNTIMTMVYPPRANLGPNACNRDRLLALNKIIDYNVRNPEFTNLTIYRTLHPEYNWDAIEHYADQVKEDFGKPHASQLAILCMRNGDRDITGPICPCGTSATQAPGQPALVTQYISNGHTFVPTAGSGSVLTIESNGQHLVLTIPTQAAFFTPPGPRATVTRVQIGTTVLPYDPSTSYPPGLVTEVVFASPASSPTAGTTPTVTIGPLIPTSLTSSVRLVTVYMMNNQILSLTEGPGRVISTVINGQSLVFTALDPATTPVTRATSTVVHLPNVTLTEEVYLETITHFSTRRSSPTAKPKCRHTEPGCRLSKCLWDHQKPINVSTVMPALMDDPYDGHMMYDYFTQRTSLGRRPHWGTTDQRGLYYPWHVATDSMGALHAVRETPTPIVRKRSIINPEPVVHPAPRCWDPDSCHTMCQNDIDRHDHKMKIVSIVGGTVGGTIFLIAAVGILATLLKGRNSTNPNPAPLTGPAMQTVDPVTGQSIVPITTGDSLGRTTAVDPTNGATGLQPALRSAGTIGRQAEEGRGRVHFPEDNPGAAAEGTSSALSGPANGLSGTQDVTSNAAQSGIGNVPGTATDTSMGSVTGTGAAPDATSATNMTSTADPVSAANTTSATPDATSVANTTPAADATSATTDTAPAAVADSVAQPATAPSEIVEKTIPEDAGKMAQVPEEAAEHVENVPAHDGADSRPTGSEPYDMGSLRGRRRLRPNGKPFF